MHANAPLRSALRRFWRWLKAAFDTGAHASMEVAFLRALGAREKDERLRNVDVLAERFLRGKYRLALPFASRARPLVEWFSPGAYGYINARTKHIDAVLSAELRSGMEQLVILGAGNDSRAYRMQELLGGVQLFEVDLPDAQRLKRASLERLRLAPPPNLTFVAADLERDSLAERLIQHGFRPGRKTFFNWEGVSMFLSAEAVRTTLATLCELCGPGSSILFDYALQGYVDGHHAAFHGGPQLARWLRSQKITYEFGLEAHQTAGFLAERGLELVSDVGAQELEQLYLSDGQGVRRRAWGQFRVAHARTGSAASSG